MAKKVKIKVISGGQVGADRIGLEEARKLGFDTGGTAPIKYATTKIQGVQQYDPSLKDFGVTEIDPKLKLDYSKRTGKFDTFGARTEQNVLKSDLTVIYTVKGRENSPGSKLTRNLATEHGKPYLQNPSSEQITKAVSKLGKENVTINIAGNREFKDSKIISEGLQAASSASPKVKILPMNFSYGDQGLPGTKDTTYKEIFEGQRRSTLRKAGTTDYNIGEIVNVTDKSGNTGQVKITGIRKVNPSMAEELSTTERWKPEFIKNYIKSGSWEQISYEPVSKSSNLSSAIKSRVSSANYSKKIRQKLPTEIREAQNIIKSRKQILGEVPDTTPRPVDVPPKYKVLPFDLRKYFSSEGTKPKVRPKGEGEVRTVVKIKKGKKWINDPNKKRFKSSKSFPTQKGIWFQGAHKIKDRGAVIKTLDKVYGEALKTYKKGDLKVFYGGYKGSQTDTIIEEWATKKKIPLGKIDPFDEELFGKTGDWRAKIARRDKGLLKWKEKGQLLNLYSISPSGEIKYDYKERTKWRERLDELSKKYGKGQTRKVHEAYLDEVEDELKGVSRQDASEYKVVQQKGVKKGTGSILDQGQTRSTVKKPNISSALAAIEVLEDRNEFVNAERRAKFVQGIEDIVKESDIDIKEWLADISKKRIANIRGDVSNPLLYGQRVEVDYPDQPGIPEGKEHIVTDSVGTYEKTASEKSPHLFRATSRMIWGVEVDEKGGLKKGVKVHDTNKPAMKAPIVQQLISDVVNIDPKEMGYTGKNVFGDFFKRDIELEAKKETYEGRDLNKQSVDDIADTKEGAEVHKSKHLQKQKIADKKEIHALNKLLRKMPKDLDTLPLDKKLAWEKTLLTELMNIPDTHADQQVTVLGASYSKDKKTKTGEWKPQGEVLGEKPKYRTKAEIKKALPSELLEEKEWRDKESKKHPVIESKEKWSLDDAKKKGKLKEKGAYVSDPSKASARDVRTHISTKKPLPKGLAGSLAKWLGRFSIVLAPILGYSSLKSKKAKASVKNVAQETTAVLIGSERVFGSVGNKGYFQNVGLTKKGISGKRRPGGPIVGAGGKDTPYANLMKFFRPSTTDAWKNRKRVRRN